MIKVLFVLAIALSLESAYLCATIGNYICMAFALAIIPWVLLTNWAWDTISSNHFLKKSGLNGLGKYKVNIKITDLENKLIYCNVAYISKLVIDKYKIGEHEILKHIMDNIFDKILKEMKIEKSAASEASIKHGGMVFIMRGAPGSGKSTLASAFEKVDTKVFSTDNYHIESFRQSKNIFNNIIAKLRYKLGLSSNEYKFDVKRLHYYHQLNYKDYCKSIDDREKIIVVDNTNFKPSLYREYLEYAKKNGYLVCVFTFKPADIKLHMERNIHKCPEETLKHMMNILNQNLKVEEADFNVIVEVKQ